MRIVQKKTQGFHQIILIFIFDYFKINNANIK